ncbi:MAG: hypothetical protein ACLVHV_14370 [Oscillospiraceae bacterium]
MTLREFFWHVHTEAALGFSGGVDSAYLLYAALEAGARVKAYFMCNPLFSRSLRCWFHLSWREMD